jgi:hypothetical protein
VYNDLNPKAVTNNELFGIINPATREWKDGRHIVPSRTDLNTALVKALLYSEPLLLRILWEPAKLEYTCSCISLYIHRSDFGTLSGGYITENCTFH